MQNNYKLIHSWTAAYEGGYVNHPKDPGGATNKGVTQRVYDAFRRAQGQATRTVRHIEQSEVETIYSRQYWKPCGGPRLPSGVDAAVYDYAVNSGVSRAVKALQRIVKATPDGHFGEMTLGAVNAYVARHGAAHLVVAICNQRFAFLKRLRTFKHFGKGWTRRVMGQHTGVQSNDIGIIDRAVMLAKKVQPVDIPVVEASAGGKGNDADRGALAMLIDAIVALVEGFKGGKR